MYSLINRTDALVLSLVLLVGMIVALLLGRWFCRLWGDEERELKGGVNSLMTALYALSAFILAFTFGMSANRLEKVRAVVADEATEIGTAILRADLYSDSVREGFRADFRDYVESVISFYQNASNRSKLYAAIQDADKAAARLWVRATRQAKQTNLYIPSNQMIPSLNSMFDAATTREIVLKSKVPDLIVYMLFICVLSTCLVSGFTSPVFRYKEWIIVAGFAVVSSLVIYSTLDLARPLRGIIQESAGQDAIIELRKLF